MSAPDRFLLPLALLLAAAPAGAQAPGFSTGDWKRVETEHFLFLYPAPLEEWTVAVARRMESVHEAVVSLVGHAPEDRVTVLVDDPSNVSNGSMNPGPLLFLYPTPPGPRAMIGENRGWGEILAVHELAHAAHLTRPSRNPRDRFLYDLIPIPVDPIAQRTPRWATEGYATYVEGRLTGSGRPHGAWRPAVLRTWALEGQLPRYAALSGSSGFYGGSMAYLVGSAFLEWLVEREGRGESVLPDVWRRLTARQKRSFEGAFAGVFGASPAELYGLFTVDVIERALAIRDAAEAAGGVVGGELFQRLSWYTGDPAVSPDGEHLAIALRSRDAPSRLVVVSTTPDTLTTRAREQRARIFERDPEDVEPVERRPRPQRPKATLMPTLGRAYDAPRFMPDGRGILVVRTDLIDNLRSRPDLFLWSWESGTVRRITNGAAIREADPAPDGSWAAGLRCLYGRCDIVRIDLATGDVSLIARGDPLRPYYHPRISPDGGTIVASVQDEGGWRLVAMTADGSDRRFLGPDDGAARFDAEFLAGGDTLVLVSTRGGIHDLELLELASGEVRPLTRVLGAAVAPAPSPSGEVFFLSLHSRGWDLHRVDVDAGPTTTLVATAPALTPAAPVPPVPVDTFAVAPVGPIEDYGLGPRFRTLLPLASFSVDGPAAGASLTGTDPIGRLSWQLQAMVGGDDAWRGGSARLIWRGWRPWVHVEGFAVGGAVPDIADPAVEIADDPLDYLGGAASLELSHTGLASAHDLRVGASGGRMIGEEDRFLGFAGYDLSLRQLPGTWRLTQSGSLHGGLGRTGDLEWTRWVASGSLGVRGRRRGLTVSGLVGGTDSPVGSLEAFSIGGTEPPLLDPGLLSQRVAMPALPAGQLAGDAVRTVRADLHGLLPVSLFYWAGSADGDGLGWYQVAGAELDRRLAAIPYIRLPAIGVRLGIGRTFSEPGDGEWRGWAVATYRP